MDSRHNGWNMAIVGPRRCFRITCYIELSKSECFGMSLNLEACGTIGVIFFGQTQVIWEAQPFVDHWFDIDVHQDDVMAQLSKEWTPEPRIPRSESRF